jgi:hypothetical protein
MQWITEFEAFGGPINMTDRKTSDIQNRYDLVADY